MSLLSTTGLPSSNTTALESFGDIILSGQGEYLAYYSPSSGQRMLERETYQKIYTIFQEYSLISMANRNELPACTNRYSLIKAKIRQIDPSLELTFIPRTLYELIFLKKCIEEDLAQGHICPRASALYHKENGVHEMPSNCWHATFWEQPGMQPSLEIEEISFRLNQAAVQILAPAKEGFCLRELFAHLEKEMAFFRTYYDECQEKQKRREMGQKVTLVYDTYSRGPTMNFGFERYGYENDHIYPMGLRDDSDAQIIRNALALECSKLAQHSFILYRGTESFANDSSMDTFSNPNSLTKQVRPHSLSFGTSLFAGAVYEPGATAFNFLRNNTYAYALCLPYENVKNGPFFIPSVNTVVQLYGHGDVFHARTRGWKGFAIENLGGIDGLYKNVYPHEHLCSDLLQEELVQQFDILKGRAIFLKKPASIQKLYKSDAYIPKVFNSDNFQ